MTANMLHHKACLLVCDGHRALFVVNEGHPGHLDLHVQREVSRHAPAHNAQMGTDRPGLSRNVTGTAGTSLPGADWHRLDEEAFMNRSLAEFGAFAKETGADQVGFVAPPHALAALRKHMPHALKEQCVLEVDKDLTKHPVSEMQKILLN